MLAKLLISYSKRYMRISILARREQGLHEMPLVLAPSALNQGELVFACVQTCHALKSQLASGSYQQRNPSYYLDFQALVSRGTQP